MQRTSGIIKSYSFFNQEYTSLYKVVSVNLKKSTRNAKAGAVMPYG